MTVLGELLEAVHGARMSLGPVDGTLREWRDEQLIGRLSLDLWPDEGGENRRRPHENEFEQLIDFKLEPPDRVRVETRLPDTGPNSIVVCDGFRCATWLEGWGTEVEDHDRGDLGWILGTPGRLLDPSWLLGLLEFDAVQRVTQRERPLLRARGRPRHSLPWPFGPADEHELVVDAERGTVMRLAGLLRGNEAFIHELLELEHGPRFDDDIFALPATGDVSGVGLREAAALISFDLWALPRPVLDVTYRPEPVESLTLTYDDAILVLTPASAEQGLMLRVAGEPETIERDGRSYLLSDREGVFVAGGTVIYLSQPAATGDDLIALAETLVRVSD